MEDFTTPFIEQEEIKDFSETIDFCGKKNKNKLLRTLQPRINLWL
jgi:hypothetical protein